MARIDTALAWMQNRLGKVTYSMANRNGPASYDCSSAVYIALKEAGLLPNNIWVGNTDSLFGDLEKHGWTRLQPNANGDVSVQRGDVFIWGKRGASGGSFGHTGFILNGGNYGTETIIHCNYANNGISINNHDQFYAAAGSPEYAFYRPPADPAPAKATPAPAAKPAPAASSLTYEDVKRAVREVLREGVK